jgi:tetratricopeptide (TPR) repeat protein
MREVVTLVPKRPLFRGNLAVYAAYNTDFRTAVEEAQKVTEPYDLATLAVVFAQLGQGMLPQATMTYRDLATMGERGASWSASGLADIALYQGRFADAARMFQTGAEADITVNRTESAARKFAALAYVRLLRGETAAARAAAKTALMHSNTVEVRFLAARVFAQSGLIPEAQQLAALLGKELPAEPRAYGQIIDGLVSLSNGNASAAVARLTEANEILDTWIGHFDLGRAYLAAGADPSADLEFDRCIQRRGQALALFIDEEPTFGYLPTVYYYRGLVRSSQKSAGAADALKQYLDIRGNSKEDKLAADARRLLTTLPRN